MLKQFIFKNIKILGKGTAYKLDQLSWLIKSSRFYSETNTEIFETRFGMYQDIIKKENLNNKEIIYLEFGVFKGETIEWWAKQNHNPNSSFFGFDSFEGLPERWGIREEGYFSTEGNIPLTEDSRIHYLKGWYNKTLPEFIVANEEIISRNKIIHMDSDLFTSTSYVLMNLRKYLLTGDIIIFDDFFSIRNNNEEFRAFLDYQSVTNISFRAISKTRGQIAMKIM